LITCPKCQNTLPDWAQSCQFCGGDVKGIVRPVQTVKKSNYAYGTAPWVWVVYYVLSSLMALRGLIMTTICVAGYYAAKAAMESEGGGVLSEGSTQMMGGIVFVAIFFTSVDIIVGVGLLFKNEFLRMIGTWYLAVSILWAGFNMLSSMGSTFALTLNLMVMVVNGMLIYCILETNDEC
jgi:hypothetical protein